MKIRIFKKLEDGVFSVRIHTEDWSENDRSLMVKYGEPEINLGGRFYYEDSGMSSDSSSEDPYWLELDDVFVRIMSESPFVRRFDSRDSGSVDTAKEIANKWASSIEDRIAKAVTRLREKSEFFTTEEVTEY